MLINFLSIQKIFILSLVSSLFSSYSTGAPLAPNVTITIVNATTLLVSWDKPFTWEQFDIHNYTIRVRNTTNGNTTEKTISSDDLISNYRVVTYAMDSNGAVAQGCHELQITVTANNGIGESREGFVKGGFPIGKFEVSFGKYYR